jgi:hypothetical protein
MFIDTNIVSYAKRGRLPQSIRGTKLSSVAASELLGVYSDSRTGANYYVPLGYPRHMGASIASLKRDHPFAKRSTDRIVFSFGSDFESLIEFGSNAISRMVNDRNVDLLRQSISFLDKQKQRVIRENFVFLVENDIGCVPLAPRTLQIGYRLLEAFQSSGETFKTTFRNTWNDLLILATAWGNGEDLRTKDIQLNRFIGSSFGRYREWIPGFLNIRFPAPVVGRQRRGSRGSKGYVNKGWRATFEAGTKREW